jgi:hypothetical protein
MGAFFLFFFVLARQLLGPQAGGRGAWSLVGLGRERMYMHGSVVTLQNALHLPSIRSKKKSLFSK